MPGTGAISGAISGAILVLNAGSSSIKFALFDHTLTRFLDGSATEIGGQSRLCVGGQSLPAALPDHAAALAALLDALAQQGWPLAGLAAAGHRVVHGGTQLTRPSPATPDVVDAIRTCIPFAPLHNPHNLAAIQALARLAPGLKQFVSVDTGFHASNPPAATTYALPQGARDMGLRRYGFHGLSYAGLVRRLPDLSGAPLPGRLLAFHLGNGASIAALRDGRSVATSMGYSPVSGMTMGTRVGEIDANAVLQLAQIHGIDRAKQLLNAESGLMGLSGHSSDMRVLIAGDSDADRFAVAHFCYWATRQAGSLIAAMGGLDAIAFTGGIGEHAAPVRARIMDGLGWLGLRPDLAANARADAQLSTPGSAISAWIVPADEERVIAEDAQALMQAS